MTHIHQEAFDILKSEISKEPILKLPDFSKMFCLQTDASEHGAGAALLQEHNGCKHPTAYASKRFSDCERAQLCLALIWGIKNYLYGKEFCIETDHEHLSFVDLAKVTNSRIMRWALFLQDYKFKIHAIKGSDNVVEDYLSRNSKPQHALVRIHCASLFVCFLKENKVLYFLEVGVFCHKRIISEGFHFYLDYLVMLIECAVVLNVCLACQVYWRVLS